MTTPNPLITLLRQCIVRIDDAAGGLLGTGFFVAPGRVVTCAHVVHGQSGPVRVVAGPLTSSRRRSRAPAPRSTRSMARFSIPCPTSPSSISTRSARRGDHPCVRLATDPPVLDGPEQHALPGRVHGRVQDGVPRAYGRHAPNSSLRSSRERTRCSSSSAVRSVPATAARQCLICAPGGRGRH